MPSISESGAPVCRHTRSVYIDRSGMMGMAYTSSAKEITRKPNLIKKLVLCTPRRKSRKSGYNFFYLREKYVGGVSPQLLLTWLPFPLYAQNWHHQDKKSSLDFSRLICMITSIFIWYFRLKIKIKSWTNNLKNIFDQSKQSIESNKPEHPTITLATTFHKPVGGTNPYFRLGYDPHTIF